MSDESLTRQRHSLLITHNSFITHYYRIVIIHHILLDGASEYEKKSHRIDAASFQSSPDGTIAHIYAAENRQRDLEPPYAANTPPKRGPFSFRKRNDPREIGTP